MSRISDLETRIEGLEAELEKLKDLASQRYSFFSIGTSDEDEPIGGYKNCGEWVHMGDNVEVSRFNTCPGPPDCDDPECLKRWATSSWFPAYRILARKMLKEQEEKDQVAIVEDTMKQISG